MNAEITMIERFSNWTESRQPYRLPYLIGMIIVHGNITAPFSLYAAYEAGNSQLQFGILLVLTLTIVVVNLAAMPTKITIPVFITASFISLMMFLYNLSIIFFV